MERGDEGGCCGGVPEYVLVDHRGKKTLKLAGESGMCCADFGYTFDVSSDIYSKCKLEAPTRHCKLILFTISVIATTSVSFYKKIKKNKCVQK